MPGRRPLPYQRRGGTIQDMRRASRIISVGLLCASAWLWIAAAEPNSSAVPVAAPEEARTAIIPCKGMIDDALFYSIQRRTRIALDQGADYLIYDISTYGGLVQAADDISKYLILEVADRAHTVAYVATEAISAGAMVSVACEDIVMRENTTIGDAAPITMGGQLEGVEREKAESFIRAIFQRAAEANGYPELLLKAMVSMQIEVYRVRNLETDEYEFFEGDELPEDPNAYDVEGAEKIDGDDELLTLTAPRALEYGIARAVVDDLDGAMAFLEDRYDVAFAGEPIVLEPNWSEQMVSWLTSPALVSILFMLGLLGIYVEFSSPGFGLPGIVGVACFAIIFGSRFLVGLANWVEIAVLVLGVVLLLVEFFVLPGFGIAGFLGIGCIFAGLFGMLIRNPPDEIPWPDTPGDWESMTSGVLALSIGFAGFLVLAWLISRYLPKTRLASGLILTPSPAGAGGGGTHVSMTLPPEPSAADIHVGDVGTVVSSLRPAGKARFGEALTDVVAEGEFLDVGTEVEIMSVHGSRVVVRRVPEQEEA